jgi:hypothetical protein
MWNLGVHAAVSHAIRRESSAGTRGNNGGGAPSAWRTRRHFIEHVAGSERGKVGVNLGRIQAEFGHGPKMKFALQLMLSNFD